MKRLGWEVIGVFASGYAAGFVSGINDKGLGWLFIASAALGVVSGSWAGSLAWRAHRDAERVEEADDQAVSRISARVEEAWKDVYGK